LVFFLQIRWCFCLLFCTPESRSCCHRRLCPSALVFILVQETVPGSGILFIYHGLALFVVHSCVRHCQTSAGILVVLVLSFLLFLLGLGLACWSPRQAYILVPFLPSVSVACSSLLLCAGVGLKNWLLLRVWVSIVAGRSWYSS
jgi:hypothetical protein